MFLFSEIQDDFCLAGFSAVLGKSRVDSPVLIGAVDASEDEGGIFCNHI